MFDVGDLDGARAGEKFEAVALRFHDDLAGVVGLWNAVAGELIDYIACALEHGLWDVGGIHSPEQWLGWQLGVGANRAHQLIGIARRYQELPAMAGALRAGELSLEAASVIARRVPPWAEDTVVEFAKWATIRQLRTAVNGYGFDPDPDPKPDPDEGVERRLQMGAVDEQRWRMIVETTVDEGAAIEAALVAFRDQLFHQHQTDEAAAAAGDGGDDGDGAASRPVNPTECGGRSAADISWVDALAEMVEHAMAHGGESRPHSDRYKVLFHYQTDEAGHPVMTPHGAAPLPDSLRRLWTCDGTAAVVQVVDGKPVNVGRTQHIVPRRTRRLVEHRDGGCRVPGCTVRRWVQVHHIVHWEDHGPTNTHNLICLCPHHHRTHHRGLLGIVGNADEPNGVTFTDHHGRLIRAKANARPPGRPIRDEAAQHGIDGSTWHPASGERLDYWCVDFGQPPNPPPDDPPDQPGQPGDGPDTRSSGGGPEPQAPPGKGGPTTGGGDPPQAA